MALFFSLFLLFSIENNTIQSQVYAALEGDDLEVINQVIQYIESAQSSTTMRAYKGALLMRKARMVKGNKDKLDTFKSGHELLEAAIAKEQQNIEFLFLRLIIQEHAPKFLKYNSDIGDDKSAIILHYKSLNDTLQKHILNYTTHSQVLKKTELIN